MYDVCSRKHKVMVKTKIELTKYNNNHKIVLLRTSKVGNAEIRENVVKEHNFIT